MELFALFLKEFDSVKEGDGTVLDNSLIFAFTDQSFAKIHAVDGLPMFTAGKASGRMNTGYHIDGASSPVSRVGLTLQKAMSIGVESWGTGSMETKNIITDILSI